MAKASKPPGPIAETTHRRLNLRGLVILGVLFVVGVAAVFPIRAIMGRSTRQTALAQAKASETTGDVDLALRHMERYVTQWPDDLPGLSYQAKLLAQTPQSIPQLLAAAQANDRVLRLDPKGPESQDVRRRIAQLYIRYSDALRLNALAQKERGEDTKDLRYRTATTIARQMIANGAQDAEAHRLLAMSLEGTLSAGDRKALDEAITEYRRAIALEPTDTMAPDRLANLLMTEKKDPAAAEATMDALLKASPDSVPTRMARYRFYIRNRNVTKSLAEMEAAAALAPENPDVQAAAAADAIQRLDFVSARRHIDAIPAVEANQLQIRTLRGTLDLSEMHPDEAIEEWRKGLLAVGGTSSELTWRLAYTLIGQGRLNEARPVVKRYQSLAGPSQEPAARFLRALFEQRGGHPASAIRDLNRIADQINPALRPDLFLTLGRCHEALGDQSQAMIAYQKAAGLVPSSPIPRREIARVLGAQNPIDAANEMERALNQNPDDLSLLVEVGRKRFEQEVAKPAEQRRWEGVTTLIKHGMELDPRNVGVQTLQADMLASSGRLDQAAEELRRSLAGPSKKIADIWLTYAGALDRLNRREEALQVLEQASTADAAGDHTSLRVGRAKILTRLNRAQAARDVLTKGRELVPKSERPELPHALAELCRELGDRNGARDAMADWARQIPDKAEPGLALLAFAQTYNDDAAARLGLEALRTVGGDVEPYGLAARALELLRIDRPKSVTAEPTVPTNPAELKNLDDADKLVAQLNIEAPQLAVVPMLQGMILERRGKIDEAIDAYRRSVKDGTLSPGVARLVELLSRRGRFAEIEQLKAKYETRANSEGLPALISSFTQLDATVALKLGDNERAEKAVAEIVAARPDDLSARASQARLLSNLGKNSEAEATLRQLTGRRPNDPDAWLALVAFRIQHPELGSNAKILDEVRTGFRGPHPELLQARCLWLANEIPAAIQKYDAALAQNGDDLTTLRNVAEFDEANKRPAEAEAVLRRAVKIDPKLTWASRALALNLTARPEATNWQEAWSLIKPGAPAAGKEPEDRLILATVMARSPDSSQREESVPSMLALANDLPASHPVAIEARVRLAQAFLEARQVGDAAQIIAPVADDIDRPNPAALAIAIEATARAQELDKARKYLDRLEVLEPKSPRTNASRVWVLEKTGQTAKAFAVAEAGYAEAENNPQGEQVALAFQDLLTKVGDSAGALKLARRIAVRWPRYASVLARSEYQGAKPMEAIRACRVAMEAGEIREALQVATAIAVEKRDDPAVLQAIDELASIALSQSQKNPEYLNLIATLRHLQGRYEEEIAMYRQALENTPKSYTFLNNMAWTLCEGLQRYPEALERIDEAVQREGKMAQFLDTRGVILARLTRLNEAIADLEASSKAAPSATTYFHLARTYRQLKKMDEYRRNRDLARQFKLDTGSLDPTDKADMSAVMNGN